MANSDGYPWESEDDRLQYTRVFIPTAAEQFQMDAALALSGSPAARIRRTMMAPQPVYPRYGPRSVMPDILTCWEDPQIPRVHSIMDYTDDEAGLQASSRPSLGQW